MGVPIVSRLLSGDRTTGTNLLPTGDPEWLRVVVETAAEGVILTDATGAILVFNPACEKLFGYTPAEAVGDNVRMLMPSPFVEQRGEGSRRGARTAGIGREAVGRRKDGTIFPLELSVSETVCGGAPLYVGILHDITERKRGEERRRELIDSLLAANVERGHFSHVASHDIQEHLRMVLSFGSLLSLEYGPRLDDKARQYITLSLRAAQQMRELVDDLVEYDRLDASSSSRRFDAGAETALVLEGLKDRIAAARAGVAVGGLPKLSGNPVRFRRLMQNLLGNAIKYVPPGVRPEVRVSAEEEGEFWRFCVRDNGLGIDPDHFQRIFEPFKRLHPRARYPGSGLGLAICEKIVAGFGGRIWVESAPGAGAAFCFTIPKKGRAP